MTILKTHGQLVQETLDEYDSVPHIPDETPVNPITARAKARDLRTQQRAYALATFIFGCLCEEEVLHFDPNNSDDMSDMQCGIRIIARCIKNYIDTDASPGVPFEW